jgi:hypothetical protein
MCPASARPSNEAIGSHRETRLNFSDAPADRCGMPSHHPHLAAGAIVAFGALLAACGADSSVDATTYSWCRSVRVSVTSFANGETGEDGVPVRTDSLTELVGGVTERAPAEVKDELERLTAAFDGGMPSEDQFAQIQADLEVFNSFIEEQCGVRMDVPEPPSAP